MYDMYITCIDWEVPLLCQLQNCRTDIPTKITKRVMDSGHEFLHIFYCLVVKTIPKTKHGLKQSCKTG